MPFNRPTLPELIARVAGDIDSGFSGTDSRLRRANTAVIARASAGLAHGLHGHLEWISLQIFITTADEAELIKIGAGYGLTRKPAQFAEGVIPVAGNNGAVIPVDTLWQRADGVEYRVTAEAAIADGNAQVSVVAVEAGKDGNAEIGVKVALVGSLEGVNPAATVTQRISRGADLEDLEVFRARVLERRRRPPAGGNKYDYVAWATNISGVADAWTVSNGQGPGTVDLVVLADPEVMGSVVPDEALLATVRAVIVEVCPDNVKYLRVLAPELVAIDFSLRVEPDTATVRAAVLAELVDLIDRAAEAAPRLGTPALTIPLTQVNEAVSLAAGETNHALTVPAGDVMLTPYQLPVMGDVTWLP